jgi:hypothetical protein
MAFHVKNFDPKKDHASDAYLSKSEDIYVICDKLAIYPSGVPGEASCHAMFPFPRLNANVIFSVNEHQFANIESLRRDIELQIGSFIDSRSKGN